MKSLILQLLGALVALAIILCYWVAYGQAPVEHAYMVQGKVAVEWKFVDETRVWLSVNTANKAEWQKDGYNPSFTYILSQYIPKVKKLPDGQFEITFTSEITKNLP